jgi:hypothetical protein
VRQACLLRLHHQSQSYIHTYMQFPRQDPLSKKQRLISCLVPRMAGCLVAQWRQAVCRWTRSTGPVIRDPSLGNGGTRETSNTRSCLFRQDLLSVSQTAPYSVQTQQSSPMGLKASPRLANIWGFPRSKFP